MRDAAEGLLRRAMADGAVSAADLQGKWTVTSLPRTAAIPACACHFWVWVLTVHVHLSLLYFPQSVLDVGADGLLRI